MEIQKEFEKLHKGLGKIDKRLDRFEERFASKDDMKEFATKDDIKAFATKDDLKDMEKRLDAKFATKDDLKLAMSEQTKELKQFAEEQTEHLAQIIATTVAEPLDKHLQEMSVYEKVSMAAWKQISQKHKPAHT